MLDINPPVEPFLDKENFDNWINQFDPDKLERDLIKHFKECKESGQRDKWYWLALSKIAMQKYASFRD